jgi:hypothetical protein
MTTLSERRFHLGDKVYAKEFVSGLTSKVIPRSETLTVTECRTIESYSPHHRIKASGKGSRYIEGAECYFEFAETEVE